MGFVATRDLVKDEELTRDYAYEVSKGMCENLLLECS